MFAGFYATDGESCDYKAGSEEGDTGYARGKPQVGDQEEEDTCDEYSNGSK
jgi:hypothetical protein